jgi:hypothetical protein
MHSLIVRFRCAVLAAVLLAPAGPAAATTFVFPRNGLSSADEAFVLYTDNCGRPHPDPQRVPEVRPVAGGFEVDVYLEDPDPTEICLAAPPPNALRRVPLGRLALGFYSVRMREHVRPFGGTGYTLLSTKFEGLEVRATPNPAVSGTWFDRTRSGTGVMINLVESAGALEPRVFVILNTLGSAGQPLWYWGLGTFADARLEVPLSLGGGGATGAVAVFEYTGCGRATFSVSNLDVQFPAGTSTLQQLTGVVGVAACEPPLHLTERL